MNVNDIHAICMVERVQGGGEVWKMSAEREINIIEVIVDLLILSAQDSDKFEAMDCYNDMKKWRDWSLFKREIKH